MRNYSKGAIFAGKQADKCNWKKNKIYVSCIGTGFGEKGWLNDLKSRSVILKKFLSESKM